MKVAVIGGGASGMVSAIFASKNDVTIFEKNDILGKKILITGNGRCNYFNSDMDLKHYTDSNFLKSVITTNNINEMLLFFEKIGIVPNIKNGYFYPKSNKAKSVQKALEKELILNDVKIINEEVTNIEKKDKFIINGKYEFDKVVLATGSKSYPKTGSDGKGYDIAKSFNHTIIDTYPALVPLITEENIKTWAGSRTEVKLSLYEDDKFIKEEKGEIQFTDYGISGICVFNLSLYIDMLKDNSICINFVPWIKASDIDDVLDYLDKRSNFVTGRNICEFLNGFLDEKIIETILNEINIDKNKYYEELNGKEKYGLAKALFSFKLNIKDTKSYDNAQITKGGVSLDEIKSNMESKIVDGLYIVGELLDVNGQCGGYNLAFAFISGMIAGESTND